MLKQTALIFAALGLCYLAGVLTAGLIFTLAVLFGAFPRFIRPRWYEIVAGALLCNIAAMLSGDKMLVFWLLLLTAAIALSLAAPWKTALIVGAAWVMLRLNVGGEIYIPLFAGAAWSSILLFTYEKKCDTIEVS